MSHFTERFSQYFQRSAAIQAASSLKDHTQMEFRVGSEVFTFSKKLGKNHITPGSAENADLTFSISENAANDILDFPSENIGEIGIHIAKLIVSHDETKKIKMKLNSGFLSLMTKGYFGILKEGGSVFASFLATKGLGGLDGIKNAIKKLKG